MNTYTPYFVIAATGSGGNILTTLQGFVGPLIGCTVAFVVIFWLSLIIWTFRDIRSRTQDMISQILATVLVAAFFVGGLFIYMILRPRQTLAEIYKHELEEESLLAEMTKRQTCSNCHARIESDFQVCPSCSQKLKRSCPKCERLLELRWTLCPYCANKCWRSIYARYAQHASHAGCERHASKWTTQWKPLPRVNK